MEDVPGVDGSSMSPSKSNMLFEGVEEGTEED